MGKKGRPLLPIQPISVLLLLKLLATHEAAHSIPKKTDDGFNAAWGYQREFEAGDNCIDIATSEDWEKKIDPCGSRIDPKSASTGQNPKVRKMSASLDVIARNSSIQQRTEQGRATRRMIETIADGSTYNGIEFDQSQSRNFDQFYVGFRDPVTQEEITEPKIVNIPTFNRGNLLVAILPDCSTDPYTLMPNISKETPLIEATSICTKNQVRRSYEIMASIRSMSTACTEADLKLDFDCKGLRNTLSNITTLPFIVSLSPQHCPVTEEITGKINPTESTSRFRQGPPKPMTESYTPKIVKLIEGEQAKLNWQCPGLNNMRKFTENKVTLTCYDDCKSGLVFNMKTQSCEPAGDSYFEINATIVTDNTCEEDKSFIQFDEIMYCHDDCDKDYFFEPGLNNKYYCVKNLYRLPVELSIPKELRQH